jgi:hypothetical protein
MNPANAYLHLCHTFRFHSARQGPGVIKPGPKDLIQLTFYADNWAMIFINGKIVAVDPVDFLPHSETTVNILPDYPMTIAILAKDNADPLTGLE